jgi:ferric-dicitrate binding protein FerR (iron transport regulator)
MDHELLAAYLAGATSEAEKSAVEAWRQASPANEREFGRYQALWEASRGRAAEYEPDMDRAWRRIQPARELSAAPRSGKFIPWVRRMAAVLLVGLLLGAGWYAYRMSRRPELTWVERHTPGEQRQRLQLADGSVVWLNANSTLRYPQAFTDSVREVHLAGEAFFEVARDPAKPFLIHTGPTTTRVLGTSFSVRGYAGEVAVTVVTGKVALTNRSDALAVTLTPGERGVVRRNANRVEKSPNRDPNFLAWKTRTLTFRNTPLREVLPTLERYFGVTFRTDEPTLLDCRFTGSFREPTLAEVLQVFAYGRDIAYRQAGRVYRLSGKGCR